MRGRNHTTGSNGESTAAVSMRRGRFASACSQAGIGRDPLLHPGTSTGTSTPASSSSVIAWRTGARFMRQ